MNFLTQQRWQAFRSTEALLTIPPFAPVQLGSRTDRTRAVIDDATGEYLLLAGQCWEIVHDLTDSQFVSCGDVAFNGPTEVLPGERGVLTFDTPCISRYTGETDGLLTPTTSAIGDEGWELQNVLPTATSLTTAVNYFRRLGFIDVAGRSNIVVQRLRLMKVSS